MNIKVPSTRLFGSIGGPTHEAVQSQLEAGVIINALGQGNSWHYPLNLATFSVINEVWSLHLLPPLHPAVDKTEEPKRPGLLHLIVPHGLY
jgi:hypothetical protein